MRNELIFKQALAISEIQFEIEEQYKKLSQLNKKRKSPVEEYFYFHAYENLVLMLTAKLSFLTCVIIELAGYSIDGKDYEKIRNEGHQLFVCVVTLLFCSAIASAVAKISIPCEFFFWRKEPSVSRFIDFSAIINAIEAIQKTSVNIPDNFICIITQNIITEPACIIDRDTNKKLPGIYEKSQLTLWLNNNTLNKIIPKTNISFNRTKHRVEDDNEAAKEIQEFMVEQLRGFSVEKKATLQLS